MQKVCFLFSGSAIISARQHRGPKMEKWLLKIKGEQTKSVLIHLTSFMKTTLE